MRGEIVFFSKKESCVRTSSTNSMICRLHLRWNAVKVMDVIACSASDVKNYMVAESTH